MYKSRAMMMDMYMMNGMYVMCRMFMCVNSSGYVSV